jgi:hypothetical protein
MKANPYVLTFHGEADIGPAHVLYTLIEYAVELRKNGGLIISGLVVDVNVDTDKVSICPWITDENGNEYPSMDVTVFDIYNDFDEVVYL